MKKSLFFTAIIISTLGAVEFRVGRGSYDTDLSIKEFLNHDTTNDITVFSLSNAHQNISQSPIFYYYDAELHTSSTKRQKTEFANFKANYEFPLVGSINQLTNNFIDMFPVDGDYQAVGFDMNFGLGYDVVREGESYLGLALNLGATLPTINAKNLKSKVSFAYDLTKSWDLKVRSYKVGPAIKGNLALNSNISLFGSFSLGFQKASVESELFKSSIDVNGRYSALDMGLKYHPQKYESLSDNLYFTLGYTYKHWSVDSTIVNLYNFFEADVFSPFSLDLKSSYVYIGVGYQF